MATLIFGAVVLSLVLMVLNAFTKTNPRTVAVMLKAAGGVGALGGAALALVPGTPELPASEWLVWPLPGLLSPFAGVFYPLSTLPSWMRAVAHVIPPAYISEDLRAILAGRAPAPGTQLWTGRGCAADPASHTGGRAQGVSHVSDGEVFPVPEAWAKRTLMDAAAWAATDDRARALLAAGVQQRLVRPGDLMTVAERSTRLRRRQVITPSS